MTTKVDIEGAVKRAIEEELKIAVKEEIDEAVARFQRRAQDSVGRIVLSILNYYSVERMGSEVLIRVKIDSEATR